MRIRVREVGSDSVLGRVVELLAEVEHTATPVLRMFEQRAAVWPAVPTVAATTLFFSGQLSRAIAVLVVATPTALIVAGPDREAESHAGRGARPSQGDVRSGCRCRGTATSLVARDEPWFDDDLSG